MEGAQLHMGATCACIQGSKWKGHKIEAREQIGSGYQNIGGHGGMGRGGENRTGTGKLEAAQGRTTEATQRGLGWAAGTERCREAVVEWAGEGSGWSRGIGDGGKKRAGSGFWRGMGLYLRFYLFVLFEGTVWRGTAGLTSNLVDRPVFLALWYKTPTETGNLIYYVIFVFFFGKKYTSQVCGKRHIFTVWIVIFSKFECPKNVSKNNM